MPSAHSSPVKLGDQIQRNPAYFILPGVCFLALAVLLSHYLLADYVQEMDFLNYRLALNLSRGSGYVFNPDNTTLVKLSPGLPILLSLFSGFLKVTSQWISIISYSISAILVYMLLERQYSHLFLSLIATVFWLVSWPLSNGFGSEYAPSFLLILLSIHLSQRGYDKIAALLQGIASLFTLTALIPSLLLGLQMTRERSIKQTLLYQLLPVTIWGIYAWIQFEHVAVLSITMSWVWQDWLWLILFVVSCLWLILSESEMDIAVWILIAWVVADLVANAIWFGQLPRLQNPALVLPIALVMNNLLTSYRKFPVQLAILSIFAGIVAFSQLPKTPSQITDDLAQTENLDKNIDGTLAHFRSFAFAYNINGAVYPLKNDNTLKLLNIPYPEALSSTLVRLSPDYLYLSDQEREQLPVGALAHYTAIEDTDLWQRTSHPGKFQQPNPVTTSYSAETFISSYTLDKRRVAPGDTFRLRLDWTLERPPELELGIRINVLDFENRIISTDSKLLPPSAWETLSLSTYHELTIHDSASRGIATILVRLDYRAGIMGEHPLGHILIASPPSFVSSPSPLATLGSIALLENDVTKDGELLTIQTKWMAQEPLTQDFRVYVHLVVQQGNDQPAAQSDGSPQGGRFPTSYWQVGEGVSDSRSINLADVSPNIYELRVGWYSDDGMRLQSRTGRDYYVLAVLEKQRTGAIILLGNPDD